MSKQIANTATTTSFSKVPLSAEALEAKKQAERRARREAHRQKRNAKLAEVQKNDPTRIPCIINFREFRESFLPVLLEKTPELTKNSAWANFCIYKAGAFTNYWMAKKDRPQLSEKAIERKKAKLAAAKEKLAKMQAELEALVAVDSK